MFTSSEIYQPINKNVFLIGDAFFAFSPSFAQGASQSIEGGYELFNDIANNKNDFYNSRVTKGNKGPGCHER